MKTNLKPIIITIAIGFYTLWSCNVFAQKFQNKNIKHVIVIGVDGLSPDGIKKAETPVLDNLIANGAYTFHARAVLPSSSSSNWASMIMGADIGQHGITSNDWKRTKFTLPPMVATSEGFFPTIFNVIKDQRPKAKIGTIYDWDGFGRLFEKSSVDFDINGDHEDGTTKDAVKYLKENKPTFTFIHLDHVDHAGHKDGHGSKAYYKSVEKADMLINKIIQATKNAGYFEKTLFIICSDHGGIGYGHGGETLAEMEIPFILYGAGIKKGYKIEEAVYQTDNATTVAYALGLKVPLSWRGRAIKSAFIGNKKPVLKYKQADYITPPVILPKNSPHMPAGSVFQGKTTFTIQNPNNKGEIYYSLDTSIPTLEKGKKYTEPVEIEKNTIVNAAVFIDGKLNGSLTQAFFRVHNPNKNQGLNYEIYFIDGLKKLPDFSKHKPIKKGKTLEPLLEGIEEIKKRKDHIAIVYKGYIQIDNNGEYKFYTNSDDGSKLYINNQLVVDNDGNHSVKEKSGSINLKKGLYPIRVEFYNGGGGLHIDTRYKAPNIVKQLIPVNKLFFKK